MKIDLRSDTVTKPTPEMLAFMMRAEVGDDVFAEDPTVNALEIKVASLFGKEAGVFVPSGTMSNQIAMLVLTQTGDEVIIHETGHIFNYEGSSAGWLSNVQLHPVGGNHGKLQPEAILTAIRPHHDWDPHTSVVALENTANRGGGTFYTREELLEIKKVTDENNLLIHLDGARIWNAIIASEIEPEFFGTIGETISVCFSKGLGAPVGSMLLGSAVRMKKARRFRKLLGGGMRQIGILAAAADYAIENHWPLMKEDHRRAKELANLIASKTEIGIQPDWVQSNIVIFDVKTQTADALVQKLASQDILVTSFGAHKIRVVYHFQINEDMHQKILSIFSQMQ